MIVEIYSIPNCPYCSKAKCYQNKKDMKLYKMMGEDFQPPEVIGIIPRSSHISTIIVDGEKIGGYTELEKLIG